MLTRREVLALLLAAPAVRYTYADDAGEWISLFDGKFLNGWKAPIRPDHFSVSDGQISVRVGEGHLYYSGPVRSADFKNFEFSADAMTQPGTNSAICFHTLFK